ncbi:putative ankyrin repeat protein [Rosellinia necatrix]|uniref:Putative ankyrin repeat protein n=1 Tax=Rosellinia necatrix TaxID=77044 RepID=A0A1W2TNY3_ROSNE|nr:putative ankyrin repeat protein [Rosellinia necatrix]
MPISEPFAFPDEERLASEMYSFEFDMDGTAGNGSLMKDTNFMGLQAGDEGDPTIFDGRAYAFDDIQQASQNVLAADKSDPHPPSHRGSTSSSSSLRSVGSNSPHTSMDAMSVDVSPGEWLDDIAGNEDAFNMESSVDMSQYLTLPGDPSSPEPTAPHDPSPDFHMPSEALPQGRAIKRRKAQPKTRTKQSTHSTHRPANKNRTRSPRESSPVAAQLSGSESSPTAIYPNNLSSPDGNFNNNFSDAFSSMGMPTSWLSAANSQISHQPFPPPRPELAYIPPTTQDISNGNPPPPLLHPPLPRLVIHPMPVKSRVETQIPLKITLHNSPKGIKKVHLPTHTISKPKLLQKPPMGPSPDTLELTTMLVCTSAMRDEASRKRAFGLAAGKPSLDDLDDPTNSIEDEENKPQNGGEVRICMGCILREKKRASRKKHKKPEEDELWSRYQYKRAIVFNTQEVKEWQTVTPGMADPTGAGFINGSLPEGTVQVDAPMRIACYCRHHGEKLGFQVIITLKDYVGTIIAQGISSSIMITDDHKTPAQAGPPPTPQLPSQPQSQHQLQLQHSPQPHSQSLVTNGPPMPPQAGMALTMTTHVTPIQPRGVKTLASSGPNSGDTSSLPFRQTHSTDPQIQAQNAQLIVSSSTPHAGNPQVISTASTPRNLSRQTSPASPLSVGNRKRKASMGGKIPTGLAMTKIETKQPPQSMLPNVQNDPAANPAGNSSFLPGMSHGPFNGDLSNQGQQNVLNRLPPSLSGGPPTPNGSRAEPFVFSGLNNRPINLELSTNQMFSAPASAHPSRAPSPSQLRPDAQNLHISQRTQDMPVGPLMPLPAILRIIPNEGSKSGGAEITVLGSNFTNDGLEVYFGSQKAITTTYWGPTSLVCMLPPSPVSGPVPVTIKHPGRRPVMQQQHAIFNYRDDDEDQLIRTALGVLASQYGAMAVDPAEFARRILFPQAPQPGPNNQPPHGNGNNNFNRFNLEAGGAVESSLLRILEVMDQHENPSQARINLKRPSGQTMLHLACSLGFIRFVAGLLSRGANVNMKDKGGFTPLHMAVMNDQPEIVRRLVAKGADQNIQSRSGLRPIDLARSQAVRRSLQHTENHFRSRSLDSRPSSASSPGSATPLTPMDPREFLPGNFDTVAEVDNVDSSEETAPEEDGDWPDMRGSSFAGMRRRSIADPHPVDDEEDDGPASSNATMAAIREQVATQLQQFQHTMTMHFQNLSQLQMPNIRQMPNLPPMPVLPNYQAYLQSAPVMQRISSLVPNIRGQRQEPTGTHTNNTGDNRWAVFPFFGGGDSPPAYGDIFPQKDLDVKQASAAQAAAEFEADAKCTALFDQGKTEASRTQEVPALLQIGRKHHITKEQQETLQRAHAQSLKTGSRDKMLWFVWIPILVLVLGAVLWNGAPSFVSGTVSLAKTITGLISNPREISNRARSIIQELA